MTLPFDILNSSFGITSERLTPATLAKAFRGELVPQDPNDEPASKLLERLRSIGPTAPAGRGRRKAAK
jgi:type I restriction enzyme S subunit